MAAKSPMCLVRSRADAAGHRPRSLLVAERWLTDLADVVAAAERVGRGDFSARLLERGPPFLRSVARAFNTMTTRLEAQERQRRDLMADVAPELAAEVATTLAGRPLPAITSGLRRNCSGVDAR